ncbi:MAG TPA: hypothetical protein VLJ10_05455 [Candidatus Bathyarchaeia archaeon]|nr:hypothetical protein [Candidatus Bathyarchaeia archaeon]
MSSSILLSRRRRRRLWKVCSALKETTVLGAKKVQPNATIAFMPNRDSIDGNFTIGLGADIFQARDLQPNSRRAGGFGRSAILLWYGQDFCGAEQPQPGTKKRESFLLW